LTWKLTVATKIKIVKWENSKFCHLTLLSLFTFTLFLPEPSSKATFSQSAICPAARRKETSQGRADFPENLSPKWTSFPPPLFRLLWCPTLMTVARQILWLAALLVVKIAHFKSRRCHSSSTRVKTQLFATSKRERTFQCLAKLGM